jgi:hypothetical protein
MRPLVEMEMKLEGVGNMNIIYFLFNDENPAGQKMYRPSSDQLRD